MSKRHMKKSKHANASDLIDGVDRISNLPDPILHMILSRLQGTEEVVRTSILSTRWRYLWTSAPSIDIDCNRGSEFNRNKFKRFVEHVLASNSLDLDSFRVSCSGHFSISTIRQWIHSAVARNIKQLHLLFRIGVWFEDIELPHCLVNHDSLEALRLFLYRQRLILPQLTGFTALRVLELNNVELSYKGSSVKKFLESCPLLEDLGLIDCEIKQLKVVCISCPKLKNLRLDNRNIFDPHDLYDLDYLCGGIKINCPKLVSFEFVAFAAQNYIFKSLGLLKKAVIHPEDFPRKIMDHALWFAGVSHLESLSTSIEILCVDLCPSDDVSSSISNLKILKLTTGFNRTAFNVISKLIRFLTCHPHLESLHLIIEEKFFFWGDWKLDEAETRSILTRHLKKVEFHNFYEQKILLDVARSLLEHGNELEEMVFGWNYLTEAKFHEMSVETMKEVSKFQKASSTVKLIFLNEISYYQLSGIP